MKKEEWFEPFIDGYYDEEEKELIEGTDEYMNRDDYVPVSVLTPELRAMYQRAASRALEPTEK